MSYRTKCNFCTYQRLKSRAAEKHRSISVADGPNGFKDVFIYPPNMSIEEATRRQPDGEPGKYFVASFMVIPDQCCC